MWDIHAVPAYGRDYKSKAEVLKAWQEGKDFRDSLTGQYFSIREMPEICDREVWVRYDKLRKLVKVAN